MHLGIYLSFRFCQVQPGFSLWSFRRAYLKLYFDLCFDFLFFNKIYETSLLQEFCVFYSHLTQGSTNPISCSLILTFLFDSGFLIQTQTVIG